MQLSVVSYLDEAATKQVRELQKKLSHITDSNASLTSWQPHITVGDGLEISSKEFEILTSDLETFCKAMPPITISSHEFNARDSRPIGLGEVSTPYVLELQVEVSEALENMVTGVGKLTNKYQKWYRMPVPYHPHITIAFRDLDEKGYWLGIDYLRNKSIGLTSFIDHVALVEKLPKQDIERIRFALG